MRENGGKRSHEKNLKIFFCLSAYRIMGIRGMKYQYLRNKVPSTYKLVQPITPDEPGSGIGDKVFMEGTLFILFTFLPLLSERRSLSSSIPRALLFVLSRQDAKKNIRIKKKFFDYHFWLESPSLVNLAPLRDSYCGNNKWGDCQIRTKSLKYFLQRCKFHLGIYRKLEQYRKNLKHPDTLWISYH